MKLKTIIENLILPKKFSNYKITTETIYNVMKLNISKNVVVYSTILESDIETFAPNFNYHLAPMSVVYLYVHHTNKLGEVSKICLGTFKTIENKLVYLQFTNSSYKYLIRAIKNALGGARQQGRTSSVIDINASIELTTITKYSLPKRVEYYTYTFSNGTVKTYSKENCYKASDLAIQSNIEIVNIKNRASYEFEKSVEQISIA